MRPTGPQRAEDVERRREPHAGRSFARRIDCDGGGYAASTAGLARDDTMREPSTRTPRLPDSER